jgi:hypothetical protein
MIKDKLFIGSVIVLVISVVSLLIIVIMDYQCEIAKNIMYFSLGNVMCSSFVAYFTIGYDNQPVIS